MERTRQGRDTVVVTGASAGIGEELARLFARDGHDLVLVARDEARLRQVGESLARDHGVRFEVVVADLSDPAAPEEVFRRVREMGVQVDALVNNAGFGVYGPFVGSDGEPATDLARELAMIQVNVSALVHLSKLFLPAMVARGVGQVLNVASTAAFQPGPTMAIYYATKAFVLSFSQAVAVELEGTGVTVTALCPGPTHTRFAASAQVEGSRLFKQAGVMSAEEVARIGYDAMRRGKTTMIAGTMNAVMARATRLVPRTLAARLAMKAQERAQRRPAGGRAASAPSRRRWSRRDVCRSWPEVLHPRTADAARCLPATVASALPAQASPHAACGASRLEQAVRGD